MIVVVGLSHRTAPVEVREKLATNADALPAMLARLSARPELREVIFLSTCNRVEVMATANGSVDDAVRSVREVIAAYAGGSADELVTCLYEKSGPEAVRHVFRVAASLDSMVLGEPQILGQVKQAHDAAQAAGTLGSFLGRCMNRAFTVAKRVRSETQLGAGTVSISSVAVDLARSIFGDLRDRTVLLVGAGEMAEAAARSLGRGAKALRVCNRSFERGAALAKDFGADVAHWEHLEQELGYADVVVASTASPVYVVTRDMMKRVMKARRGRMIFVIDIAVPRNVNRAIGDLDNVFVYDVDDLEKQVAKGLEARKGEAAAAEQIVAFELKEFEAWAKGLDVAPAVVALRARTRAVLLAEMERSLSGRLKHLPDADRAALTQMIDSAVNKLLHAPTTRMREGAADGSAGDLVRAMRHLFDLPEGAPPDPRGRSMAPSATPSNPAPPSSDPAMARDDDDERLPN